MSTTVTEDCSAENRRTMRRIVYILIAAISLGGLAGRIMQVEGATGNTPFLSANDRSRWSTIRSLVDHGTFILDDVILRPNGKFDKDWHSIDLVRHRGHDGREHYYSSKPPLLTVLFAGEYRLVRALTGATLEEKSFYVGRIMLLVTNGLLFALILGLLAVAAEDYGRTDAGRIFVVAAGASATALTTFGVTLSNHLPAAACALATLMLVLRIRDGRCSAGGWYALAGLTAAMTVVGELPALSIMPLAGWALWRCSPLKTAAGFLPAAGMIAAAAVGVNYVAHGTITPAYSQRKDGPVLVASAALPKNFDPTDDARREVLPPELLESINKITAFGLSAATQLKPAGESRWMLWDPETERRLVVVPARDHGYEIRRWDNWYDYSRSYWTGTRKGVDRGEASRLMYLFHVLVGHHGLFSLTPLWLLAVYGGWLACRGSDRSLQATAWASAALFAVCLAFYLSRPLIDRNYGGVSCTFRWLLWQVPLWLVLLIPAADRLFRSRWGIAVAALLLAISVFSAQYNSANPWRHPWIYDYWSQLGWIDEG